METECLINYEIYGHLLDAYGDDVTVAKGNRPCCRRPTCATENGRIYKFKPVSFLAALFLCLVVIELNTSCGRQHHQHENELTNDRSRRFKT